MRHNLDRIFNKPTDYIVCDECESINWYENEVCTNCACEELREVSQEYIQELCIDLQDGYDVTEEVPRPMYRIILGV